MLFFIGDMIGRLFGKTANSVGSAVGSKVKRETVGKAEAKVMGAQVAAQQKAIRAASDPMALAKGKGGDAAAPLPPGVSPQAANAPAAQNVGFAAAPYQEQPPMSQPPQGGGFPPPSGGAALHSAASANRTVAISAADLLHNQHATKSVVGWIVCMEGQQKGQDFRLHDGRNVIGTAADCDIVVFDPYLSARHCIIVVDSAKADYAMQDLDSRNGVYINRSRVSKQHLIDNDQITLGQAEFRFKALY